MNMKARRTYNAVVRRRRMRKIRQIFGKVVDLAWTAFIICCVPVMCFVWLMFVG